jgi:hypothetical protein
MFSNLKALVVIVVIAFAVFHFARPFCMQFMSGATFDRRRNIWFALTIVAFVSPSFWLYAAFALVLLYWGTARDENPLALYVLVTFTVPNVHFYIPGVIFQQLFDLTQYRILSLAILIPTVFRMWKLSPGSPSNRLKLVDVVLIAFLLLQVVLLMPYESLTNAMRRTFLFFLDTYLVFYVFSRISEKGKMTDALVCFWLSCALMAPVAIFESTKGWLLYTELASAWGDPNVFAWIFRDGSVRAQAATEHSLNLGYVLAVGLGFFLYLRNRVTSAALSWLAIAVFSMGIFASGSRGAWITAALVVLIFVLIRPDSGRQLAKVAVFAAVVVAVMYMTPLRESVIDRLPIIGTADQDTVIYRQQLAEASWPLIRLNPFFGDPFVYLRMEALRQGQGIIDIVNGYLFTALFTGLVGFGLQVSVLAISIFVGGRALLRIRGLDADLGSMGAALLAALLASLFFIAAAGYSTTTYILAGLLVAYATIVARHARSVAPARDDDTAKSSVASSRRLSANP